MKRRRIRLVPKKPFVPSVDTGGSGFAHVPVRSYYSFPAQGGLWRDNTSYPMVRVYDESSWKGACGLVPFVSEKDGDGDREPLTSTKFDGDSFSSSSNTIDWNADFGMPVGAKMVNIYLVIRDSGAAGQSISFKAKSTTTNVTKRAETLVGGDVPHYLERTLPIAADGTTYYDIIASGTDTFDLWIRVMAWWM